ncbi:fibroblast growth factor receptor substrate 3-like [Penaeus japonicus]|uniref:fibroblast growth factor receptor substrate 3-like n=1 Tax=Penaeus japonicus TaxID=27405 RepID=UPI001C70DE08|nr:fibroblast growth factor receptor substrate 3-like [Penaeus japonicus]
MGCVAGKPDINDLHANIFQVVNVDDLGHRFSAAKLEVTETHLVLHQRARAPVRWPLRCLRRYGFDAELFSFEAGRRCPTGPGIYAFKCRRAEALFNLLQLRIQNITEDAASRDALPPPPPPQVVSDVQEDARALGTHVAPDTEICLELVQRPQAREPATRRPNPMAVSPGVGVSSGGAVGGARGPLPHGSTPSPPTPISPPPASFYDVNRNEEPGHEMRNPPPSPTEQIRHECVNHTDKTVAYEKYCGRPVSSNSYPDRSIPQGSFVKNKRPRSYVNIKSHDIVYVNVEPLNHNHDHNRVYENLVQEKDVPAVPPRPSLAPGSAGSGSSYSGTTTTTTDTDQPSQINYISLDLDRGSDSSQAAPLSPLESMVSGPESPPNHVAEGYATIDFARTNALSNTAKQAAMWEDGSRKTRHNSTLTSPATLTRHNSSLSD